MTKKANFFIVGAAKAGTTSVYTYLKQHSEVYMSPIKEPNFFSTDVDVKTFSNTFKKNLPDISSYFSQKPLEPLQQAFIRDEKLYKKLFEDAQNETIIGEASTGYLYSKTAAQNIYKYNPNSKILIILREPISRTFSHYLMAVRFGFTTLDFLSALKKDIKKEEKGIGKSEMFVELSLYYDNIKQFLELFPEKQIKICFYEHLKNNQGLFMEDVFNFLNISKQKVKDKANHNKAEIPKHKRLNKLLTDSGIKAFILKIMGSSLKDKAKKIYLSNAAIPEITKEEKAFLQVLIEEDVQKTKALLHYLNFPW